MDQKRPSKKVISLVDKALNKKNPGNRKKEGSGRAETRVIAITSGKGGVGKTNLVANLGFALGQAGENVLILDADLGLGNLDVLLGLTPRNNISHFIAGTKELSEIVAQGPGNVRILPASSGIQELTNLTTEQKMGFLKEIDLFLEPIDVLLIDTAAGISSNVMYFNSSAQEIVVVVSPEPTSITDAYALMKVLSMKYSAKKFKLIINLVKSRQEAYQVFGQLETVTNKFLDISMEYLGHVLMDEKVTRSVQAQRAFCEIYPNSRASICVHDLAERIHKSQPEPGGKDTNFLWDYFLHNNHHNGER